MLARQALAIFEPAQILEHGEAQIRVAAEGEVAGCFGLAQRRDSVAEVALGQRTEAGGDAAAEELVEARGGRVRAVDRRGLGADVEIVEQELGGRRAVGGDDLFDLSPLLLEMEMHRQPATLRFGMEKGELLPVDGAVAVRRDADRFALDRSSCPSSRSTESQKRSSEPPSKRRCPPSSGRPGPPAR